MKAGRAFCRIYGQPAGAVIYTRQEADAIAFEAGGSYFY